MNNLNILSIINDDGIDSNKLLLLLFKNYEASKAKGKIYTTDFEPKGLIKIYYRITSKPQFEGLMKQFKTKYIINENKLECVHSPYETEGLKLVYDYIQSDIKEENINLYLLLKLHAILFSKTPFPEFGGKFRNKDVYLPGSGIETESYDNIASEFQKLYLPVNDLIKEGLTLSSQKDIESIMEYIDKCIILNVKLIKIHPFFDGNGRTCRAFLNLLFKIAGIPPVYLREKERKEYNQAMNKAIINGDYSSIKKFYYYKICDSIYELDIKEKLSVKERSK